MTVYEDWDVDEGDDAGANLSRGFNLDKTSSSNDKYQVGQQHQSGETSTEKNALMCSGPGGKYTKAECARLHTLRNSSSDFDMSCHVEINAIATMLTTGFLKDRDDVQVILYEIDSLMRSFSFKAVSAKYTRARLILQLKYVEKQRNDFAQFLRERQLCYAFFKQSEEYAIKRQRLIEGYIRFVNYFCTFEASHDCRS